MALSNVFIIIIIINGCTNQEIGGAVRRCADNDSTRWNVSDDLKNGLDHRHGLARA